MIRPNLSIGLPAGQPSSPISEPGAARADKTEQHSASAYDAAFWFAYGANFTLTMTAALLYHYADFVVVLGGTEKNLGWIVGIGAVGSLLFRLVQGRAIDQCGPRLIWLLSLGALTCALLAHLLVHRVDGPFVYLVRTIYQCGLAAAFGCSITYITLRAPPARTAEVVGILGSSGFVGMISGSQLGDLLCRGETVERWQVDTLFLCGAALALVTLLLAALATRGAVPVRRRRHLPLFWLVRRYHPGFLLVMAAVMGLAITLPGTFLLPFVETRGLGGVATFFSTYAVTAFVMRLATRRFTDRVGVPRTVLIGAATLAASMLLYLVVDSAWTLALPGVAAGIAHALFFPAIVAGGSTSFPARHRGTGTTLLLSMFDVGQVVGLPLAGNVVYYSPRLGLPSFPTLFVLMAGLILVAATFYLLQIRKQKRPKWNGARKRRESRGLIDPTAEARRETCQTPDNSTEVASSA